MPRTLPEGQISLVSTSSRRLCKENDRAGSTTQRRSLTSGNADSEISLSMLYIHADVQYAVSVSKSHHT